MGRGGAASKHGLGADVSRLTTTEACTLGGCLCGALRYAATGAPIFAGLFGRGIADPWFDIYAGSLDDPTLFRPVTAIYTFSRVPRAGLPPGLETYEKLPG